MHSTMSQGPAQAPRAASTAEAENARLDAQLELAAKKAALRGFEAQAAAAGGAADAPVIVGAPMPPMPPMPSRGGTIMIEKDGKTIVLENPTAEQLQQVGVARVPPLEPKIITVLTVSTLIALVTIVWMVLHYLRRGRGPDVADADAQMAARMARIENAIESVAVEVERISEGQRFTSRLLSEGAAVPVSAGEQGDHVRRNGEA